MNKTFAAVLVLALLISLVLFQPTTVKAQSKTIIVPDNFKTITSAIGNASNGDTILVRAGIYEGPCNKTILITKSISIIGENTQNTILKLYPAFNESWILTACFFSYTDAITITADYCTIQSLTLNIANPGGFITSIANHVLITNDRIQTSPSTGLTVNGSYCRITQNTIDGRTQVNGVYNEIDENTVPYIGASGQFNLIKNNICQSVGLYASTNSICLDNKISCQSYGDSGVGLDRSSGNLICKNEVSGLYAWGFRLWHASDNIFEANTINSKVLASIYFGDSSSNKIFLNNFVGNASYKSGHIYDAYTDPNYREGSPGMSFSINAWNNSQFGNYWGDYLVRYPNAAEVDSSGVGNNTYLIDDNNIDWYPLITVCDISKAIVQMPDWTNLSMQALLTTPSFPPLPTLTPSLVPSQSSSINQTSTSPSQSPLKTYEATKTSIQITPLTILILLAVAALAISCLGLFVFLKKRKLN